MSWVSRLSPRCRAYVELMRWDRPVGIALLLWPTWLALWFATKGFPSWKWLLIFTLGTILMRSAGCVINDYADRDIDGKVWRTKHRPLAEGRVTPKEALYLAAFLASCSATLLIFLPLVCWGIAVVAVCFSALYPWTKRFLPIPQAFLGITFSLGVLMAWAAVTQTLPLSAWLLWMANVSWVLAYDTAYAMADRPDDISLGIHSSALWLGGNDLLAIHAFTGLFLAGVSLVAGLQGVQAPIFWLSWVLSIVWLIIWNNRLVDREPAMCLQVFRQHHWAGVMLCLGVCLSFFLTR